MALAKECYLLTRDFPKSEMFGMTSQLRRAAVSVAANLAEGNGRGASRDNLRFVAVARGSLNEVETLLRLAIDVELTTPEKTKPALSLASETGRLLTLLRRSLLRSLGP
jgi:four helix bundle protein